MKAFFKKKELSDHFLFAGFLLGLLALILYLFTGRNEFNQDFSISFIVSCSLALCVDVLGFFFPYKALKYGSFVIGLFGFVKFISANINYITNVFVSIDNTSFSASFLITFLSLLLSLLFPLVSGILSHHDFDELFSKKKEVTE